MVTQRNASVISWIVISIIALAVAAAAWLWIAPLLPSGDQPAPPDGTSQTPAKTDTNTPDTTSRTYTSAGGVTITVTGIAPGDTITSPLIITGQVPGSWSHEGNFPIDLAYGGEDLISVGGTTATLDGDWMTSQLVPFSATLTFTPPKDAVTGVLMLRNANLSDLPENDDSVGIPVTF